MEPGSMAGNILDPAAQEFHPAASPPQFSLLPPPPVYYAYGTPQAQPTAALPVPFYQASQLNPSPYVSPATALPDTKPTRTLLLSSVPPHTAESAVRVELESFGGVRAVEMGRALGEGLVTVHFYDLRSAQAALAEIREQHVRQQSLLGQQYGFVGMVPGSGSGSGTNWGGGGDPLWAELESSCGSNIGGYCGGAQPAVGRGLIAGRAVWAQFAPETAGLDGPNNGSLVVFNLDSDVSSAALKDVFEVFGRYSALALATSFPDLAGFSSNMFNSPFCPSAFRFAVFQRIVMSLDFLPGSPHRSFLSRIHRVLLLEAFVMQFLLMVLAADSSCVPCVQMVPAAHGFCFLFARFFFLRSCVNSARRNGEGAEGDPVEASAQVRRVLRHSGRCSGALRAQRQGDLRETRGYRVQQARRPAGQEVQLGRFSCPLSSPSALPRTDEFILLALMPTPVEARAGRAQATSRCRCPQGCCASPGQMLRLGQLQGCLSSGGWAASAACLRTTKPSLTTPEGARGPVAAGRLRFRPVRRGSTQGGLRTGRAKVARAGAPLKQGSSLRTPSPAAARLLPLSGILGPPS